MHEFVRSKNACGDSVHGNMTRWDEHWGRQRKYKNEEIKGMKCNKSENNGVQWHDNMGWMLGMIE